MTPQRRKARRVYAFIDDERLDFAGYRSADDQEEQLMYYAHAVSLDKSLTVNLREAFEQCPLLSEGDVNLRVIVSGRTTFVPIQDFQEEDIEDIYYFNFPDRRHSQVFYDVLPALNAVLIFSVPEVLCHVFNEYAPQVYFVSAMTPLLRHFAEKKDDGLKKHLFIYLNGSYTDIAAIDSGKLLMSNKYNTRTAEDVAYYALSVAELLSFQSEDSALYICGNAAHAEGLMPLLKPYMAHVFHTYPKAEFNRHAATMHERMPYPLMVKLATMTGK